MKRFILILMILVVLLCSTALAKLIDTSKESFKDETLVFPDLQTEARDANGKLVYDRETKQLLYKYHIATNEILKATAIGLIDGYSDGTFRPDETITKAEFIKLAITLATNRNFDFSAIPTTLDHWSGPYVTMAEMQNVVDIGEYNDFNLNEPITRIEMICILSRIQINMKGISQYREAEMPNYTDIENLTEEEKELLLHAAKYELISDMFTPNSKGEYTIRPYDNLTRGDAAIAIMRVY